MTANVTNATDAHAHAHTQEPIHIPQRPYDPSRPMNVLLLYADDWRYDTLGAAGNKL
eukprot:CAMPEP_0185812350 /NCGR_PEP_ID=MMETSP1322-20130828/9228_1 /TAXON_ID=265543 /ORGANISM="Minutocellus polymorphus, Strain RCC2270" /LENGTH=56 /DNA_ID=CAMNT_0028508875 /DNA_START=57 /DNA_END=224 /DNA_ORIENTATION=-